MGKTVRRIVLATGLGGFIALVVVLSGIVLSRPETDSKPSAGVPTYEDKQGDQELAYLLVKLELKTRAVIGGHYTRAQSIIPGVDLIYKRWIAKNTILPAAVADRVFSEVVPGATGGRAWVKMVVEDPRNPHNRGDSIAVELLGTIQGGNATAERSTPEAYYYAEPIKATSTCLPCHGEPEGAPDPLFPQYEKDGWRDGDIVGAVVARVAPELNR
ncbi:MAG: DUF3365 domain-containing protein [Candidatus Krumholzibacteria bacterium]